MVTIGTIFRRTVGALQFLVAFLAKGIAWDGGNDTIAAD
jgi:hypothetical protein